jgi:hypothetical protein
VNAACRYWFNYVSVYAVSGDAPTAVGGTYWLWSPFE